MTILPTIPDVEASRGRPHRRKGGASDGAAAPGRPAGPNGVKSSLHRAMAAAAPAVVRIKLAIVALQIAVAVLLLLSDPHFPRWRIVCMAVFGALAVGGATYETVALLPRGSSRLWAVLPTSNAIALGVTVAMVGGATGPLTALLFFAPVGQAARNGPGPRFALAASLMGLTMLVLIAAPDAWFGPPVAALQHDLLWISVTLGVALALGGEVSVLRGTFARTASHLAAMREDILSDHDLRVRGLESIGARVAHEIKNPLTSVKALLSLEREEAHGEETQRRLEVIDGEVGRIHCIVRDYLSYARPLDRIRPRRLDLLDLARHAAEVFDGRRRAAAVDILVSGASAPVEADPHQVRGVLLNLLANAIEATPPGGTVGLETAAVGDDVILRVRDTGRGMSAETLARVGTPYFTTRARGTGLGVVIARAAVEQHGGSLGFESTEGVGTTVTVHLPRRARLSPDPTASYDELVHPELGALVDAERRTPVD